MANYTLTDSLLFSAGAILVNLIYIYTYTKNPDYMSLDAGDSRCHRSSFDGEKERMTQKASVNGSYNYELAESTKALTHH